MKETPNINYIKKLSGGDEEFEKHLLEIIKEEFPQEYQTYSENFEKGNLLLAAENVHKLKHKISILGLERGYELADEFEEELKEGNPRLAHKFKDLMELIESFLNSN